MASTTRTRGRKRTEIPTDGAGQGGRPRVRPVAVRDVYTLSRELMELSAQLGIVRTELLDAQAWATKLALKLRDLGDVSGSR